ncbi:Uncharacterised protein [Bordetella pertussis]|nr:Uncharacterised protein [Bordetella pertussis]CFN91687.1 Uncharacterised protein [Bordetella pertussis]CFW57152.1 Uncharacterised protein [Bordetella pertussis]CPJ20213.1 Uncharacterised protein [Bordetella pertussis]CPJ47228.1 Uncharacterised protein [Bordetella pertussis]
MQQVAYGAQRERAIGAGAHPQPQVRLLAGSLPIRIHHHHPCPALARRRDPRGLRQPGPRGVVAPQQHGVGVLQVRHADAAPEGQRMGIVLVPATDLDRVDQVGAAEHPHESLDPLEAVHHGRAAGRGDGERNAFGAIAPARDRQPRGHFVQGFGPLDFPPAGVGRAARIGPPERAQQAMAFGHHFRRRATLGAQGAARRMAGKRRHGDQPAVLNVVDGSAARPAQRAVPRDLLHVALAHVMRDALLNLGE